MQFWFKKVAKQGDVDAKEAILELNKLGYY